MAGDYYGGRYWAKRYFSGRYWASPETAELIAGAGRIEVRGGAAAGLSWTLTASAGVVEVHGGTAAAVAVDRELTAAAGVVEVRGGAAASLDLELVAGAAVIEVRGAAGELVLTANYVLEGAAGVIEVHGGAAADVEIGYFLTAAAAVIEVRGGSAAALFVTRRFVSRHRPRIYIHDASTLRRIAQLTRVKDVNRSYSLRERVHTASFVVATSDPAYALTSEHFAHVIVIESRTYPYPWVGRIVERSRADRGKAAKITADSYEAILGERFLPPDFTTQGGTDRAIRGIIGALNGRNATGVDIGYIEAAPAPTLTLPDASGIEAIDQLADLVDMEWWIGATINRAGDLRLDLNMIHERGADLSASVRLSGPGGNFELEDWHGTNRGNAYATTVVGGQQTSAQAWTERERARASRGGGDETLVGAEGVSEFVLQARRSIRFGHVLAGETAFTAPTQRREQRAVIEALKAGGDTGDAAQRLLERRRFPARGIIGKAILDADTWPYLDVGNVVWFSHPEPFDEGYDGPATILDVQPIEQRSQLQVILEVE